MWLPKDERKLLVHYYTELSDVESRTRFYMSALEKLLKGPNPRERAKTASKILGRRNLIAFFHNHGDALTVQLSLEGHDLGRKYSSWWLRSNLWYAEYIKNHWIWLIGSFIAGIIATSIAQWLSKVIM